MPAIFACAQHTLRSTFAFELVEMRARGAENPLLAEQAREIDARVSKRQRTAEDPERRRAGPAAQAYLLRSTLPPNVIACMTRHREDMVPPLDWKRTEGEQGTMGLLFVVLSLVLLGGRQISESTSCALRALTQAACVLRLHSCHSRSTARCRQRCGRNRVRLLATRRQRRRCARRRALSLIHI